MTHPLTDEMIDEIQIRFGGPCSEGYDDNMRAAADWQLEQVVSYLEHYTDPIWYDRLTDEFESLIHDLKEAMRPQVVDLPQANSDVCGEEGAKRALQRTIEENYEAMRKLADS